MADEFDKAIVNFREFVREDYKNSESIISAIDFEARGILAVDQDLRNNNTQKDKRVKILTN
jgi:hypothetical protein